MNVVVKTNRYFDIQMVVKMRWRTNQLDEMEDGAITRNKAWKYENTVRQVVGNDDREKKKKYVK